MARIVSKARQLRLDYQARVGRTVTVEEVAELAGVDRGALTRLELGRTERYDGPMLAKLCTFYGVKLGALLELVEDAEDEDGTIKAHKEIPALRLELVTAP